MPVMQQPVMSGSRGGSAPVRGDGGRSGGGGVYGQPVGGGQAWGGRGGSDVRGQVASYYPWMGGGLDGAAGRPTGGALQALGGVPANMPYNAGSMGGNATGYLVPPNNQAVVGATAGGRYSPIAAGPGGYVNPIAYGPNNPVQGAPVSQPAAYYPSAPGGGNGYYNPIAYGPPSAGVPVSQPAAYYPSAPAAGAPGRILGNAGGSRVGGYLNSAANPMNFAPSSYAVSPAANAGAGVSGWGVL